MTALVAALVMLAGCGGSDDSAASAETEAASTTAAAVSSTTTAAEPETTTTVAATTTVATTSTTTTTVAPDAAADEVEPAARDLRLVALSLADLGDGYQENFVNIAPQGGLPVIAPCGQEVPVETPFQAASNWIYPVNELGWPPDGVVYDVLMIAHQVALEADDVVAQVEFHRCVGVVGAHPLFECGEEVSAFFVGDGHVQCLSSVLISRGGTTGRSTRHS
jgi:hypothetical protein